MHAPVTSATPHIWNQDSLVLQIMFISSHEIEHSFSNKAQRLVYWQSRRPTKQQLRNTRNVADSSQVVHSPSSQPPHFFTPLTTVKNNHFSAPYIFRRYCTYLHNDDQFWPWQIFTTICRIVNHHTVQILVVSTTVLIQWQVLHHSFSARQKSAHTSVYC